MSDPVIKGVKRSPSRPASRQTAQTSSAKNRATAGKSAKPQPLKKRSAAEKAPARKATKAISKSSAAVTTKNKSAKTTKSAVVKKIAKAAPKASKAKPKTTAKAAPPKRKTAVTRKAAPIKPAKKRVTAPAKAAKPAKSAKSTKPAKVQSRQPAKPTSARKSATPPPPPPRQPTQDEAAALRAFERAHKEFARGRFTDARQLFRALLEKHAGVSEVAARARTYLAIAESRLRAEPSLPRDADSLYDRGVIELNRGDYVAAQELFERALKREPSAAHIHYGLAATRSRLGSIDSALESLQRALEIQPTLRIRAQHDQDLTALRNVPEFEHLVFAPRF
jgi:tetratricopeptide (TPR) repeat protein